MPERPKDELSWVVSSGFFFDYELIPAEGTPQM
jgi:hypothetical protein